MATTEVEKKDNAREEGRGESGLGLDAVGSPFPPFPHGRGKVTTQDAVLSVAARVRALEAEVKALTDLEADDGEAF